MHWILKIILHLFFWGTYCLFAGLISFRLSEGFGYIFQHMGIFLMNGVWAAVIFYAHYFFLYRIILQRKFLFYFLLSVAASAFVTFSFFLLYKYVVFSNNPLLKLVQMLPTILGSFIIGNCGSLVRGFISWFTESSKKTELERQSLSMELELLRSQLNHHFLFNTLNNIDALIFINPHKASDALIALSSILRYMLYETKTEKVPFDKELENIQHIIHLEQLRIPVENYTRLTIEGPTAMVMVPPLLFVSFVENAYKHSVNMGKLPVIDIHFRHLDEKVHFTCKNSATYSQPAVDHPGNLGLENIARRLNLLYADRCKLNISHTSSEFIVDLEIPC